MAQTILEEKKKSRLMTEGSIWKSILLFSVPLILGNLLQQLYNTADSIIVGNFLGSNALAAVGSSGSPIYLLIGFSQGVAVGAGVVVSQYLGAKDKKETRIAVHTSLAIAVILGLILTVGGIAVSRSLLVWMNTPEEVLGDAVTYMKLYFGGVLFSVVYNMAAGILNAAGNSRRSVIYLACASITNIILDPIFIFVFNMGVAGAAWATIISQALSALWAVTFLSKAKSILRLKKQNLRIDMKVLAPCIALGVAPFAMQATESVLVLCFNSSLLRYGGDLAVGAMTILTSVMQFAMLPLQGLGQGAQPIISYNYGLNESQRVRRAYLLALKTAIGCGVCFALATIFCSPEIVGMFIDRSYPAYDIAVKGLPLYATGFVFFAVNIVSIGYFQSVERAKYATVITLLRGFILLTACFFGLPLLLGDRGIWLATPLAEMLTTLFILVIYISGKRKHKEKSVSLDKMGCTPT